jgi:hypothetical protein
MKTNAVADAILARLSVIHAKTYRNAPPSSAVFPYVVFDCETVTPSTPSDEVYIYVNVFEDPAKSVRAMNDIADSIDALDDTMIINSDLNLHLTKISRQFVSNNELTTSKAINLQYSARVYWK